MKNSIQHSQVIWARHCSNLYVLRTQNKFVTLRIQFNHNMLFKMITMSFVYFWQVKDCLLGSNIAHNWVNYRKYFVIVEQIKPITVLSELLSWKSLLSISFFNVNFQQRFHIHLVYQVTLSYKLGDSRKLGLRSVFGVKLFETRSVFVT